MVVSRDNGLFTIFSNALSNVWSDVWEQMFECQFTHDNKVRNQINERCRYGIRCNRNNTCGIYHSITYDSKGKEPFKTKKLSEPAVHFQSGQESLETLEQN